MKKIYLLIFLFSALAITQNNAQQIVEAIATGNWINSGTWQTNTCEDGFPGATISTGQTNCPDIVVIPQGREVTIGSSTNIYYDGILIIEGTLTFNSGNAGGPNAGRLIMNAESEIFLTSTSVIRAVGNNTNQTNNNYITIGSTQINGSGINQTNNNAKPNQLTEGNLGGGGCSGLGNCDPNLNDQIIALPIELKTFTAHLNNGTTQLNWTTAKEENFSHFELERSVDQQKFEMIGIIQGRGESFSDLYYDFEDSDVPYGKIYYRLKAVDIDDTFEYSPVISVENSFKGKLSVYPNPVQQNEEMKIKVPGKFMENISYMALYDIQGILIQEFIDFDPVNNLKVNTKIKSGLYLLKVQHNGLEENIRVYLK